MLHLGHGFRRIYLSLLSIITHEEGEAMQKLIDDEFEKKMTSGLLQLEYS